MRSNVFDRIPTGVGPRSAMVQPQSMAYGADAEVRRLLSLLNKSEDFLRGFNARSDWYFSFTNDDGELLIRRLREGDEGNLQDFGNALGPSSRRLFAPYPWADQDSVRSAFRAAIERSLSGVDLSYLVYCNERPVAHLVLWGMASSRDFRGVSLRIPTVGLAVVDRLHGRGIGRRCVRFLQLVAYIFGVDAVELTTAEQNAIAAQLYISCDFQEIGTLRIPLGVDPSMSPSDCITIDTWREERHMVYVANEERSNTVRAYLFSKQRQHASFVRHTPS